MFGAKKKMESIGIINTIIGDNSKIEGLLTTSEATRIDGFLEGRILSESSVIIGEHGTVRGDINAAEILVAGTVYGNLKATERIQLTETGRVLGDMVTRTLVIDEGASFKGQCTMDVAEEGRPLEIGSSGKERQNKGKNKNQTAQESSSVPEAMSQS